MSVAESWASASASAFSKIDATPSAISAALSSTWPPMAPPT